MLPFINKLEQLHFSKLELKHWQSPACPETVTFWNTNTHRIVKTFAKTRW